MGTEDLGMACSPGTSLPKICDAVSENRLDGLEPAVATILSSGTENAEELHFDLTNIIVLFKKRNYNVHM